MIKPTYEQAKKYEKEFTYIPVCKEILANDKEGEVMAVKHKEYEIYGLQFHPESIMTPNGKEMMKAFLV